MGKLFINGVAHEAQASKNVLEVALSLGYDLPYFCWHPELGSVGACRQCAVKQFKDEDDEEGKIVMACMTPASEDTRVSIEDPEAEDFRARVIEWLMINHPHDCPVCDEGGECHLQDMTVMTGHNYRRARVRKRTYRNQDLGPFINHEMNRCIQCYRCVRFYDEYAGGRDLQVFAAHDHVYFGRQEDGTLESEFSGNLVEICPTGVFTDKTLKSHYTRKWDLQAAPSVCRHCSLGCNITPGERYGSLRRIRNRYNGDVNGYFLCDRGRYGYEFVNHRRRLRRVVRPGIEAESTETPPPGTSASGTSASGEVASEANSDESRSSGEASLLSDAPSDGEQAPGTPQEVEAVTELGERLARRRSVVGIGSPRASLEANFALRSLVGPESFYRGENGLERQLTDLSLEILQDGGAPSASMADVRNADAVLVLGEDPTNTAPMLDLALRQAVRTRPLAEVQGQGSIPAWHDHAVREAVQEEKGPFFMATSTGTKLDSLARVPFKGAPEDVARLGRAVARKLDPDAVQVADLDAETESLAGTVADALRQAERPLVVSGAGAGSPEVLEAAAAVADALAAGNEETRIFLVLPESNSLGSALMGGGTLEEALGQVEDGKVETVVILENDLFRRAPRVDVARFLEASPFTVVLDHLAHETGRRSDLVLPVTTFAEEHGTVVNNEGRAQRYFQVYPPEGEVHESWRWLSAAGRAVSGNHKEDPGSGTPESSGGAESDPGIGAGDPMADGEKAGRGVAPEPPDTRESLWTLRKALAGAIPSLAPILEAKSDPDDRTQGAPVPRELNRYSGRTAMRADRQIREPPPPRDPDSPLSFSMEGYQGSPPAGLAADFWAPGWNSVQALNRFQEEIAGPLRGGNPGIRLLIPSGEQAFSRRGEAPSPFRSRKGVEDGGNRWRVVALHHCFGSEELSVLSPGVAERAPEPYLGLSPSDAEDLGAGEGDILTLGVAGEIRDLPLKILSGLPDGCVGIPFGLPGLGLVPGDLWADIEATAGEGGGS